MFYRFCSSLSYRKPRPKGALRRRSSAAAASTDWRLELAWERDEDGCWLAKMLGAIAYGETIEEAMAKVEALALQAAGEQVEQGDARPST